ncbi:unnamed protein product, partial [Pleuronectes platessa]
MEPPPEGGGTEGQGGQGVNGPPSTQPDNINSIPPEGCLPESQSWVSDKAQESFQKPDNWSPDRPYPDELHENRHNPQLVDVFYDVHLFLLTAPYLRLSVGTSLLRQHFLSHFNPKQRSRPLSLCFADGREREMGRYHPVDGHGRTLSMPRLSADNQ